jgi:hypothetical protein
MAIPVSPVHANAFDSIRVTWDGLSNETVVSESQPKKDCEPMTATSFGTVTDEVAPQNRINRPRSKLNKKFVPNSNEAGSHIRFLFPLATDISVEYGNAESATNSQLAGTSRAFNPDPQNAYASIRLKLDELPKETDSSLQHAKQPGPMTSTVGGTTIALSVPKYRTAVFLSELHTKSFSTTNDLLRDVMLRQLNSAVPSISMTPLGIATDLTAVPESANAPMHLRFADPWNDIDDMDGQVRHLLPMASQSRGIEIDVIGQP